MDLSDFWIQFFHYLLHAESGPESVPPGSVTSVLDDSGVQGSPVMDNCGQGLPETNSSVSASGDLVLHSVSCHTLFCAEGRLLVRCEARDLKLRESVLTGVGFGPESEWSVIWDWGSWWGPDSSFASRGTGRAAAGHRETLAVSSWTVPRYGWWTFQKSGGIHPRWRTLDPGTQPCAVSAAEDLSFLQ